MPAEVILAASSPSVASANRFTSSVYATAQVKGCDIAHADLQFRRSFERYSSRVVGSWPSAAALEERGG